MYLFTYGTLRKSLKGFANGVTVGEGTIPGVLLNISNRFPGVLLKADVPESSRVRGMLWRLIDTKRKDLFEDLDYYEGAKGDPPLYFREKVHVTLDDGTVVPNVWVYEFNTEKMDPDGIFPPIPSGDWFKR